MKIRDKIKKNETLRLGSERVVQTNHCWLEGGENQFRQTV